MISNHLINIYNGHIAINIVLCLAHQSVQKQLVIYHKINSTHKKIAAKCKHHVLAYYISRTYGLTAKRCLELCSLQNMRMLKSGFLMPKLFSGAVRAVLYFKTLRRRVFVVQPTSEESREYISS